jgi:TM2 domain-containing membrane protein YozV
MIEHYIDKNGSIKRIKDRYAAIIIAFGLGWIGMHKFYLGKWGWGLIYLLFSLSTLPLIISIVEGVLYLLMSDEEFDYKYNC